MFKNIVVTLDRTERSRNVFEVALDLAATHQGRLLAFHAIEWDFGERFASFNELEAEVDLSGAFSNESQQRLSEKVNEARQWLQELSQAARDRGVEVEVRSAIGHAGPLVCQLAREWGADAVVTGRRGRDAWAEALLGSVSSYIIHHAHCTVTIVQD